MTENDLYTYNSLINAVTAMEEVSIDQKGVWNTHAEEKRTSTMLFHTTFAG